MAIEIVVTNRRDRAVFITTAGSCDDAPIFLAGADGARFRFREQADTCDAVRAGTCRDFGDCAGPLTVEIAPGASHRHTWNGTHVVHRQLAPGEGCSTYCIDYEPVPPGTYRVEVHGWNHCESKDQCPAKPDLVVEQQIELPAARIEVPIQ